VAVAFAALLAGAAEVTAQGGTAFGVGPDVPVDGLVADGELAPAEEPAGDLLRAEVLSDPGIDEPPVGGGEALIAPRP